MKWTRILPCKLWVEKSLNCLGKGGEVDSGYLMVLPFPCTSQLLLRFVLEALPC